MLLAASFCCAARSLLNGCCSRSCCDFNISVFIMSAVCCAVILSPSLRFSHPCSGLTISCLHSSSGWSCGGAHTMCLLPPLIIKRCLYCIPVMNFMSSLPSCLSRYFMRISLCSVVRCPPWWFFILPSARVMMLHRIAISSALMSYPIDAASRGPRPS